MDEFLDRAQRLQIEVKHGELDQGHINDPYSSEGVRQAIIHTRQDVVLIASYMHDLNLQTRTIKLLLFVLTAVVLYETVLRHLL
jgi:hypothetical protein